VIIPIGDQPNPRGVPIINYVLIGANVVVFLLVSLPMMYSAADPADPATREYLWRVLVGVPDEQRVQAAYLALSQLTAYDVFLTRWGYRPAEPSVITLFTSMFLHGGWLHLIGNMLFLWIYGDNVEHRLGRLAYLAGYLATGVVAALGYAAVLPEAAGDVPMVGASGAISGVLGFYFLWFPRNKVRLLFLLFPFFVFQWLVSARIVLGFYLIIENLLPFLLSSSSESRGGVAHGAHIGGFIAGLALAFVLDRWMAYRCRRHAIGCDRWREGKDELADSGAKVQPGAPGIVRPTAEAVAQLRLEGRFGDAIRLYLELAPAERRTLPPDLVSDLAEALREERQPDAALGLYRQALEDHPRGPGLDRVYLGIGLALLHGKGRPTAAYQYLLDALEADPRPDVERAAREALEVIARLQKHQLPPWRG